MRTKKIVMDNTKDLEKKINIVFVNKDLILLALTHRSFLNEHKDINEHNERLEFLGDAVLELVVSDHLFRTYPDRTEGILTSFRSALVRTDTLANASKDIGVGEYLRLSKGEEETGGRNKNYLLANTFEAIIGAIYLDQGYEKSKEFVHTFLITKLNDIVENRLDIDNKTQIQEIVQEKYKVTPSYEVISEQGPDHDKIFTVVVKVNDKVIGKGVGSSKQKAEEEAAKLGLESIEKDNT